jgi:transposase
MLRPHHGALQRREQGPTTPSIEMAFSKLKAHLRRIGARNFTDMFRALTEICELFSPDECWNDFKAAGYVSG